MIHPCRDAFTLDRDKSYQAWRAEKIASAPGTIDDLVVEIEDPGNLTPAEHQAIADRVLRANFAIYSSRHPDRVGKPQIAELGRGFGLNRLDGNLCADEDGISSLQVAEAGRHADYIPYTNKPLSWHTDGYYNGPAQRIRAFIIHCVAPAAEGGVNSLLDPELVYIAMRDANPDYVAAFMAEDVMTIPANIENGVEIRPAQSGPVFSIDPHSGALHMRYSARKRNIVWKEDPVTRDAVAFLDRQLLESPYIFMHQMQAGQGIICNNILHNRSGFQDDEATGQRRLMLRARYYDRIAV